MNYRRGFTLLEVLVATAVLTAALASSVSLITRSIFDFRFAKNKLIAANLAQEGIEFVRAIRDNNIICDFLNQATVRAWDANPPGTGSISGSFYSMDVNDTATINCKPPGPVPDIFIATPDLSGSCATPLNLDASGVYTYQSGTPTAFSRCIHICTPPSAGSECAFDPDDPDIPAAGAVPVAAQMDIVSIVTWQEAGSQRTVTLRERLYNWK